MAPCAAILAGGLGTRLRSVVNDRPKVMAPVAGRPFITHLLDQLADAGISRVVLCTGYMAGIIHDELGESYRGMVLDYSVEQEPLGTGGALRHAAELFTGNRILVMNGDSWCGCDLSMFEQGVKESGIASGMVLTEVLDVSRFGAVETDAAGRVVRFIEKGEESGPGWINAGIYLLPTCRIMELKTGKQISLERELIPSLLQEGLIGYRASGQFIDIGIPEEFQRAQTLFQSSMKGNGNL